MFRVFFCSVHLCVLLLAYTHFANFLLVQECQAMYIRWLAIWVNLLYKKDISQYTTEKFAHDYVHLAKNFGGGGCFGKVATLRTFATFG